jgi:hypothetical protein
VNLTAPDVANIAKAAVIDTAGPGTNYLSDDGTYKPVTSGATLSESEALTIAAFNYINPDGIKFSTLKTDLTTGVSTTSSVFDINVNPAHLTYTQGSTFVTLNLAQALLDRLTTIETDIAAQQQINSDQAIKITDLESRLSALESSSTTWMLSVKSNITGAQFRQVGDSSWINIPADLVLTPADYEFEFNDVTGYTTPSNYVVTMDSDKIINANYVAIPVYNVAISSVPSTIGAQVSIDGGVNINLPTTETVQRGIHTFTFSDIGGYTTPAAVTKDITSADTIVGTYTAIINQYDLTVNITGPATAN